MTIDEYITTERDRIATAVAVATANQDEARMSYWYGRLDALVTMEAQLRERVTSY